MKTTFALALSLAAASLAAAQPVNTSLEGQLRALKQEKSRVYDSLDRLSNYHPLLMSFESHAAEWSTVRDGINRSGAMLRALEQRRGSMSPAQAARLDGLKEQLSEVAVLTQAMITKLTENQRYIFRPAYYAAVKELAAKASGARSSATEIMALAAPQGGVQTGD